MIRVALLILAVLVPLESAAQLRLARVFSDGMVIQRDVKVPVWGWAPPGSEVEVTFDDEQFEATTGPDSTWTVILPPMLTGGKHVLTVVAGEDRVTVEDVLIGDVWVASGQSNMEWAVANSNHAVEEIASAADASIRHFKVPQSWEERPSEMLAGGEWHPATSEHVGAFTAVGYFFARELREHVQVPIGLINTSWGGSRIEPWMSAEALGMEASDYEAIMTREREREEQIRTDLRAKIGELPEEDLGMVGGRAVWADPDLDDASWATISVPNRWEEVGYEGLDGIAWYRTSFELSDEEASEGVTLGVGMIDDADVTWVNGERVGSMEMAWNTPRVYEVPASALREGENVVAVRVEDTGGGGGITGSAENLFVQVGGESRPIAGDWKFKPGKVVVTLASQKNQIPTLLYNKMIHPLLRFPIKGVLWYQGESNAYPEQAFQYRELFKTMITDWRDRWNAVDEDFPFLWVQLANYMESDDEPSDSDWAMLRESQSAALVLPNTAQAVAIDIGEADDIHPRNKQDVGRRLALAARHVAYGEDLVYSGPQYVGHQVIGDRVELVFAHVGDGLVAKGGPLGGFAIAGQDGEFVWADARIEGDRVVVWSDEVENPVAVRYGWADNPEDANLYNVEGLPASPFRTDVDG